MLGELKMLPESKKAQAVKHFPMSARAFLNNNATLS
jgi:hypothetical protein